MKKRTRNLFLGSGAAVAGIAAAKIAVDALARYLVSIALDRDLPPSPKRGQARLTGSGTDDALLERMRDAAAALENAGCETVTITAHDGVQMVGHWQTCEEPERVIIAMHGWRSTWAKDFGVVAESWHKQHCNVLYVEQRGQDGSGGDYMGFGLLERYDCLDWINWVNQAGHSVYEGRRLPIYLCGVSMGATSVLMAAGLPLPANVCGIVADCGFTSPHAIWKHVAERNLHLPYSVLGNIASDICRRKIQVGTQEYSTLDAMEHCTVPVLFIHGTDDHFVPVEMTYENYKACAAPKRLFVVPGAGHGSSYFIDRDGYERAIKAFWDDYDGMDKGCSDEKKT